MKTSINFIPVSINRNNIFLHNNSSHSFRKTTKNTKQSALVLKSIRIQHRREENKNKGNFRRAKEEQHNLVLTKTIWAPKGTSLGTIYCSFGVLHHLRISFFTRAKDGRVGKLAERLFKYIGTYYFLSLLP